MDSEFAGALLYSAFIVTFLMAGSICLHRYHEITKHAPRAHILCLALACYVAALYWVEVLLIMMNIDWAVHCYPLFIWLGLVCVVLLYHFVYLVTGTGERLHFPMLHYLIPSGLALLFVWWDAFIPFAERYRIITSFNRIDADQPLWETVYQLMPVSYSIYIIIYGVMAYRRVWFYRIAVDNYSADEERTSMYWIYYFIAVVTGCFPKPLITVMAVNLGIPLWVQCTMVWFPFALTYLIYNAIKGNYILVQPAEELNDRTSRLVDRKRFEHYMATKKPYLNSDLCITDLLADLCTNRTYLSSFINREYGVNFKTLINEFRLRELERLRLGSNGKNHSNMQLIMAAGFGSYRNYLAASRRKYRKGVLRYVLR
ncbi:MAG: hypothetical protein LBM06_07080 [Prevotellaceae bacterium]|jgi:AraC-like DNA-binding protein|nr:hypothetical protein [Prevotellaceae bacterium]